jgi:hypothetical protein
MTQHEIEKKLELQRKRERLQKQALRANCAHMLQSRRSDRMQLMRELDSIITRNALSGEI